MKRLSIVLPVANQEDHIERVVEGYIDALRDCECAVDFVLAVNNSRDDSIGACRRLAAAHPGSVRVVSSPPGWGHAVRCGLRAAHGSVVGFANSARTHNDDLSRAVNCALSNPHALIKGKRVARAYSPVRRFGSRVYNAECRTFFGLEPGDINGNPKLWSRDLLPPELLSEGGSFLDAEVLIRARDRGIPVIEIPVLRMDRHGGRSMTTLRLAGGLFSRPIAVRLGWDRTAPAAPSGCEPS
jgi:glycosyltransferase involved in cell wall biosynthesis